MNQALIFSIPHIFTLVIYFLFKTASEIDFLILFIHDLLCFFKWFIYWLFYAHHFLIWTTYSWITISFCQLFLKFYG